MAGTANKHAVKVKYSLAANKVQMQSADGRIIGLSKVGRTCKSDRAARYRRRPTGDSCGLMRRVTGVPEEWPSRLLREQQALQNPAYRPADMLKGRPAENPPGAPPVFAAYNPE